MSLGLHSARRLLTGGALLAGGSLSAQQVCTGVTLKRPLVRLTVTIEACDYLAVIAEPSHPAECRARLQSVQSHPTSRVHVLEGLLADSLTRVFSDNFGFLRWSASAPTAPWAVQVRVLQPMGSEQPSKVGLRLFEGDTLRASSDPAALGPTEKVTTLMAEQQGQGAGTNERTNARLVAEMGALISAHAGEVRTRWIRSVLRNVPVMFGILKTERDSMFAFARLPIRDNDIRAEPTNRPHFQWKVAQIRTPINAGADTVRDPGSFSVAECRSLGTEYSCKLTDLLFGSQVYPTPEATAVFVRGTPTYVPPMSLYVTEYSPARRPCAAAGTIPP